jgi:hypothetical protein
MGWMTFAAFNHFDSDVRTQIFLRKGKPWLLLAPFNHGRTTSFKAQSLISGHDSYG